MDPIIRATHGDTSFFKRVPVEYFQHAKDAYHRSVLYYSVKEDHFLCSKVIVERCPLLLNQVDTDQRRTPLHFAAARGVPEIVKLLADASEKRIFMITDNHGYTPLHLALVYKNFDAFKLLLEAFPDHESHFQKRGLQPLLWLLSEQSDGGRSSSHDLGKIRRLYLEKFPSQCNLRTERRGQTLLHLATLRSQLDVIKDIIHLCPDSIHLVDDAGNNFLHIAADSRFYQVVEYVLQTKEIADSLLNVQNKFGTTPLDIAVRRGDKRMLKCLNVNFRTDKEEGLYELLVKQFGNILQSAEPDKPTSLALSNLLSLVKEMLEIEEDGISEEQMSEWENKVIEYSSSGLEVSWLNKYLSLFRDQFQERGQLKGEIKIKKKMLESLSEEYTSVNNEVGDLKSKLFDLTSKNYFEFLNDQLSSDSEDMFHP